MKQHSTSLLNIIKILTKIPLNVLYILGHSLAWCITYFVHSKIFKNVQLNIEIALPHLNKTELHQLTKHAIKNEILSYLEFIHIWSNTPQKNISLIHHIHGEHYLKQALARHKGVVLVVPHFGTWEIMNAWVAQHTSMTIMYKPVKNDALNTFVLTARSKEQAELVPTDESGVKQIFRVLKNGGTTAILPDHSPNQESDCYCWFNIPVYTSQLTAKMIQKTQASALLLYAVRNQNNGFDLNIQPISDDIYQKETDGTRLIAMTLEQLIRQHPEHYHWSYKRFNASIETKTIYDIPYDDALALARRIQNHTQH